ncbi:MAG: putative Ig domain-containing protein [Bacteroidales bacterium]
MKNILLILIVCKFAILSANAQQFVPIVNWKFHVADDLKWKEPAFDDKSWNTIRLDIPWDEQGYKKNEGYGWYRARFIIPSSLKTTSFLKDSIRIYIGKIDECDQCFLNAKLIGQNAGIKTANFEDPGYAWTRERCYTVSVNDKSIKWDQENVIAVRVYNAYGIGGIYQGKPVVAMSDLIDYVSLNIEHSKLNFTEKNKVENTLILLNNYKNSAISGKLLIALKNNNKLENTIWEKQQNITLPPSGELKLTFDFPGTENAIVAYTFTENITKRSVHAFQELPYVLTPKPAKTPKINGAKVFGVRQGNPFLYLIPVSGERPMTINAVGLPEGLVLDHSTGVITGSIATKGSYNVQLSAENKLGKNSCDFKIICGDLICLTPQMGWNSWNCWGLSVSEGKVKESANAMIASGLTEHGWSCINIDDGWELVHKGDSISCNEKFPDMKLLADYVHSKGLKLGIYSSPGPKTCGGYEGSFSYEVADANNYAKWGIDYLKYDWCSYEITGCSSDTDRHIKPYRKMQQALSKVKRDIVYSLCQYGMGEVWKWGATVDANSWRTTDDINDSWESMAGIGFSQDKCSAYTEPGRWNDPDMLVVGKLGWGPDLHNTRLTPNEQYTHISLWALLSSPLLIGCDLSQLDDFTLNLLTNDEVIAVNQDPLGKQAVRLIKTPDYQVWGKQMHDGSLALGIFNLSKEFKKITIKWDEINIKGNKKIRDIWRQKDLGNFMNLYSCKLSSHAVNLIRIADK